MDTPEYPICSNLLLLLVAGDCILHCILKENIYNMECIALGLRTLSICLTVASTGHGLLGKTISWQHANNPHRHWFPVLSVSCGRLKELDFDIQGVTSVADKHVFTVGCTAILLSV